MKEFFDKNAYFPSLPSDSGLKSDQTGDVELIAYEREQLRLQCTFILPFPSNGNIEASRQTVALLMLQGEQIIQSGAHIPFALSAASLASDVRRCDCLGPAALGFYYEQQLMAECRFLVPRDIIGEDRLAFYRTVTSWNQNRDHFQCVVIGSVLAVKFFHFEKRIAGQK
ncbi:hypothetical protein SDC9_112896 [bioreactor metagenome]|uniref:Uncharacterized protein n=1 Tax=bioreactor metagenome TaxID=1076179 RepID=A0A645BLC8_9ZZZZ